jgi:hypothetical protein
VRRTGAGINLSGRDRTWPSGSQQTARVLIKNNLFTEVGGSGWGDGRLFQVLYGTANVVIDHNTGFHSGSVIVAEGTPHQGFVYRNNLTPHNGYGVTGTDTGIGNLTLRTYFPGAEFTKNVLAGPWPSADGATTAMYSAYRNNFFAPSLEKVRFVDLAGGNYRLAPSSPYRRAGTDGRDVGVDADAVRPALAAERGNGDATPMHGATCCRKGG